MCAENKGGQKVGQISLRIRYVNMSSIFPRLGLFRSYFTWSQLPSSLQPYIAGVGPVCQRQYTLKKCYLASQITPRNDFLLRKYFMRTLVGDVDKDASYPILFRFLLDDAWQEGMFGYYPFCFRMFNR